MAASAHGEDTSDVLNNKGSSQNVVNSHERKRREAIRYVRHTLIPNLRSANRLNLADDLRKTVLDGGPASVRTLDLNEREAIREFLILESEKLHRRLVKGDLDFSSYDMKVESIVEVLGWIPDSDVNDLKRD